jgi:hypothetical protein
MLPVYATESFIKDAAAYLGVFRHRPTKLYFCGLKITFHGSERATSLFSLMVFSTS